MTVNTDMHMLVTDTLYIQRLDLIPFYPMYTKVCVHAFKFMDLAIAGV